MKRANEEFLRHRRSIELQRLINLARDADNLQEWPFPPKIPEASLSDDDRMWLARFLELKSAIRRHELTADDRGKVNRTVACRLEDLWLLTQTDNVADWEWLREFCKKWADLRGVDLLSHETSDADDSLPTGVLEKCYREYVADCKTAGRRPSRDDDVEAIRHHFRHHDYYIPATTVYALRNELAPIEWKKGGPRKRSNL